MQRGNTVIFVSFIVLLLLVFPYIAQADTIVFDFSDDFQSYAQMVAQLNQEQTLLQTNRTVDEKTPTVIALLALLCKTDGRDIDFSDLSPSYVICGPRNCFTLFFASEEILLEAVDVLRKTEGIIYAEADCEVHANSLEESEETQTESHSFHSWGATQMNFGVYIDYANLWGTGSASIAVVDSGVFPHSLIRGKLLSSGYDYVDGDEDSLNDLFGHGTNVAGIIADCTPGEPVYIYPIRVLNNSGNGKMSNVVNAVREAKSKGVTVINLSLESSVMSEALDDAILEAVSSGVIVVVAAGNSSRNTSEVCPAHLTNAGVIVVGSADGSNGSYSRASYSNYGSSVDIYAFGTSISCCSRSGGYSSETGTSMAAPHVSALCALMHLIHPGLSPGQAESRLKTAALGSNSVFVTDSSLMVPDTEGFYLVSVKMSVGEHLTLPSEALPATALESISYSTSDEQVVNFENGNLIARGNGTAMITATCKGFPDRIFQVVVDISQAATLSLPLMLQEIDDETFYGAASVSCIVIPDTVLQIGNQAFDNCSALRLITIPPSVERIGDNTFSGAVILCHMDSPAYAYAEEQGLQYIALQ